MTTIPGEVNLDPNGPDFRSGGSQLNAFLNPDERIPGAEEYSIALRAPVDAHRRRPRGRRLSQELQRQPEPESAAALFGLQHPDHEPRSRSRRQPEHVGRPGHDADVLGLSRVVSAVPRSRGSSSSTTTQERLDLQDDRVRRDKRLVGRMAAPGVVLGDQAATFRLSTARALNPNAEINVADNTWTWIGKVSGSYTFPKGILTGAQLQRPQRRASGAPGAAARRRVDHDAGRECRADRQL